MADPIDPAKLSAPVKALLVDGALVALPDGATWAGAWAFPSSPPWSPDQQEAWAAIHGNLIAEQRRLDVASKALEADLNSPDSMLAQARAEVDEAQRAREAQERLSAGVKAWRKAQETYGANCRHLPTVEGDIVIMVGMTLLEADAANARAANLAQKALEADPANFMRAEMERLGAQRDAMKAKIVWPDRGRFEELATARPGLWGDIRAMRDDMARARAGDEGKGFAP